MLWSYFYRLFVINLHQNTRIKKGYFWSDFRKWLLSRCRYLFIEKKEQHSGSECSEFHASNFSSTFIFKELFVEHHLWTLVYLQDLIFKFFGHDLKRGRLRRTSCRAGRSGRPRGKSRMRWTDQVKFAVGGILQKGTSSLAGHHQHRLLAESLQRREQ